MKPDKLSMAMYYDTYGDLLTDKQRDCLDLYCNQDYTLAEIAEIQGTSRQSVYDAISRAQTQLLKLEEVTHCIANQRLWSRTAEALEQISGLLRRKGAEAIPEALDHLDSALCEIKE